VALMILPWEKPGEEHRGRAGHRAASMLLPASNGLPPPPCRSISFSYKMETMIGIGSVLKQFAQPGTVLQAR